jgi:hypothetical protein
VFFWWWEVCAVAADASSAVSTAKLIAFIIDLKAGRNISRKVKFNCSSWRCATRNR